MITRMTVVALALLGAAHAGQAAQAPQGTERTRYCMRIDLTGSNVEPVRCWTRNQWLNQGVDVDKEWSREGIRVID